MSKKCLLLGGFKKIFILLSTLSVVSCASTNTNSVYDDYVAMQYKAAHHQEKIALAKKHYSAVVNEPYYIPAINIEEIHPKYWRQNVYYSTVHPKDTILIDTNNRYLYYTLGNNRAMRYGIGVGKAGLALTGIVKVGGKRQWPSWAPTLTMMKRNPELYANLGKGKGPGLSNPLGARALYLHRGGQDSFFRIHGSYEEWSIGQAMSSGCIRMLNHDIIDLYDRVKIGTKVVVL